MAVLNRWGRPGRKSAAHEDATEHQADGALRSTGLRRGIGDTHFLRTRTARSVVLLSCVSAVFVWVMAAVLDYFVRYRDVGFWDILIFSIPLYQFYVRSVLMLIFVTLGLASAFLVDRLVLTDKDLQESLNQLDSVAETANDAVICLDEEGTVTSWNRAAASIFGYAVDEVVGRPFSMLVPEHAQDSTRDGLDRVISIKESDGVGRVVEMTGLKTGNREFPIAVSLAGWESEDGVKYTLIARDMTERKRVQAQLVAERQKMAALARNVIQSQERERLYLSGEIEDRLIQGLVSAIHNLESVDVSALPEAQQERVREVAMNLREKAEDGQQLLDEIEPVCRPEASLHGIIKRAVDLVFWRTYVKTSIEVPDAAPDVSQSLKLDILRIAEEALVNIRKHAQATHVWVEVKTEDDAITLEIRDDGVGFDVQAALSEKEGNYGLLTMQQRSVLFGGDLTIQSSPGEGTTVRATFPVE